MDKNSIIGFVLIFLIMIGFFGYQSRQQAKLRAEQEGFAYRLQCTRGTFTDLHATGGRIFRLAPQGHKIQIKAGR